MTELKRLAIRNKEESNLSPGLYIVPTPIGNLRDITLRALDILTHCDIIVCEDSRVTGQLLKAYDIQNKKKIVYNDHADAGIKSKIIHLAQESIVALVSDAGTPLISDPGYKLVRDCIAEGIFVTALPGANAILPALQLSGLPTDGFLFSGFLPAKDKGVRDTLKQHEMSSQPVIFYESAKRLLKTLQIINAFFPDRHVVVIREISKLYEDRVSGTAADLIDHFTAKPPKGEIVLILAAQEGGNAPINLDDMITNALNTGQSVKDLSEYIAKDTGLKKKDIYHRALILQKK